MNYQTIMKDIMELPPDKQEEVADFIEFIKIRLGARKAKKNESFEKYSNGI